MKERRIIKEGIELVIIKRRGDTSAMLYVDGRSILLCKVEKTDEFFWIGYDFNDNYLVVYSRGCMANQIPLKIEAVYDMTNKKVIPVTKKNKVVFEYMCVSKKGVHTAVVLEFLNNNKLDIAEVDEVEDFVRYITVGNTEITKEEIVSHILQEYSWLESYMNLTAPLSVREYRKIMDELDEILRFYMMPNLLNQEYLS